MNGTLNGLLEIPKKIKSSFDEKLSEPVSFNELEGLPKKQGVYCLYHKSNLDEPIYIASVEDGETIYSCCSNVYLRCDGGFYKRVSDLLLVCGSNIVDIRTHIQENILVKFIELDNIYIDADLETMLIVYKPYLNLFDYQKSTDSIVMLNWFKSMALNC